MGTSDFEYAQRYISLYVALSGLLPSTVRITSKFNVLTLRNPSEWLEMCIVCVSYSAIHCIPSKRRIQPMRGTIRVEP